MPARNPKPIAIRIRVIRGDTTWPYDRSLENPEVGRPIRVKVSMAQFKDTNGKFVNVGERISTIYFQQNDPKVELVIHEAVVFRTKP